MIELTHEAMSFFMKVSGCYDTFDHWFPISTAVVFYHFAVLNCSINNIVLLVVFELSTVANNEKILLFSFIPCFRIIQL